MMVGFLIMLAAFVGTFAEIPPQPLFLCLGSYAKIKGISDPAFESINYDSTMEECTQMRRNFINNIRKEIRSKVFESEDLQKFSNCIYEKLTGSEAFGNAIIKAGALEHSGNYNHSKATIKTVQMFLRGAVVACETEANFGEEFDGLFEATKNSSNYEEAYCIKRYLIKNNLIDSLMYNVDPNPHNINITGLDCEAMIKKSNDDIYEELGFVYLKSSNLGNIEKVECALEKFREADYFDLMMKITALTTIDMTTEKKNLERENFIRILSRVSANVLSC